MILNFLLKIKHRLPLNGDWLLVTETPTNHDASTQDLVMEYQDQNSVLNDLKTQNESVVKLIYERALKYNKDVENISENLKKKAEILLGMTSFVSAIFLGILSFVSTNKSMNIPNWILLIICILFIIMVMHLISSLMKSIKVMTREKSIFSSPQQIVFKSNETVIDEKPDAVLLAYKIVIADIISNTCNTHKLIKDNINMVIIAQNSFVYGLFFFMLIVGLQLSTLFLQKNSIDEPSFSNLVQIEDKLLDNIVKKEMVLIEQIEKRKQIVEKLKIKNKDVLKQFIQIDEILLEIDKTHNKVEENTNSLMELKKELLKE